MSEIDDLAENVHVSFAALSPTENRCIESGETEVPEMLLLLRQLAKDFDVKLKYDAAKQEQVDKLYKENMDYKSGILEKFKRSLILAVIEQIDAIEKQGTFFLGKEWSEENYRKLLSHYANVATDFQDVLQQQFDVAMFRSEPETPFDARRQRSLKTIMTVDPAKHKWVSRTLRPGYELNGSVLRPEMVEVYVCPTPNRLADEELQDERETGERETDERETIVSRFNG